MSKSDGGKGSSPRPFYVDNDTFESNWDMIFGKKKKEEPETLLEVVPEEDKPIE